MALLIVFGLAGSGKTYVGEVIQQHFNVFFWDADEALTDDMLLCIEEKRLFTEAMRDTYYNLVLKKIDSLRKKHEHLVISQAFYKNKNRQDILSQYPECLFLQIQVELPVIQQRLRKRNNHVDVDYAEQMRVYFESPLHPHWVIHNDYDADFVIHQLMNIPELAALTKKI